MNDQLISYTDGEGYTTQYAYDENGNLISITDPRGNSRTAVYDALNRQTKVTNEEGGTVEYTYDALGRVTMAVNEDGAVTKYTYDAKGRVTAIEDAYGNFRHLEYDPMDRVTADTDENGVRRTYEYDAKGNLIKYTDGLGNSETYTYDANDNRITLTNRNGNTYTYTYDAVNRVTSETDPKGNTKTFTYNKRGEIVAVTDRNGNTTTYTLDGNGNIVASTDAAGTVSEFTYDSMDQLTKVRLHRVDDVHGVDEYQETLYTYDHRGLVKTEVNAKGDGKVFIYDGNGNLISKTDEDGYVTEYDYSPVNLVSEIRYDDGQVASFLYDGTGDLIKMEDWNGTTSISMDLLDRIVSVTDHKNRTVEYGWDAVGNKTSQGYPDGSQVDYWYDAENRIVQVQDFDDGVTLFEYDPNGNKIYKEYPNNETAWYSYDVCDQIIEMDEYDLNGKKLYKTTYSWDAEGNRLSEMQYNHGQSAKASATTSSLSEDAGVSDTQQSTSVMDGILNFFGLNDTASTQDNANLASPDLADTNSEAPIVNTTTLPDPNVTIVTPDPLAGTTAEFIMNALAEAAVASSETAALEQTSTPDTAVPGADSAADIPVVDSSAEPETGKDDATIEGNGDGNGQVPPGQHEDEDGTIVNPGGNVAPGLNRGKKIDKPANPNKPEKPNKPGSEDTEDKKANKAQQGTHIYTYDELNRMVTSDISKVFTNYTYDTLGNLVLETAKNKSVDYEYNELNQLVKRTTTENETFTYSYDKRGNRVAETGKKESREYVYDATNRLVEGTNWKGDKSAYTYNGLGLRVNNLVTTHAGKTYDRDYVIDYTSPENDDLYVYAMGNGQLEYEQRHVYAGSERLEQITEKGTGGWERTLYVHEDVMGNTRYYTKATGQNFAELQYDAWGQPVSPNKLVNNDHGNYVFATFTGHIYDTTLDVYFAEARFYDAITRTWMAMDPIKSGLNWYSYVEANPITYADWTGMYYITVQKRDSEFITEVHKENETVMGMMGAANEILPLVNMTYNFIKAQNGAIIGSTYNDDTLAESSITAAEDELVSETLEKIATDIFRISEKTVSRTAVAVTAGESVVGYVNGTLSVKNEDILFELIENSEYNDIMERTSKDAKTAKDDALAIHKKLQLGLMLIEENDIYFNQNLAEYGYATVPSAYDISKEIEEINMRYKDPQVAEVKINQLVNGYAYTYREALLAYLKSGGLQEGEWKVIFEEYQDDYTLMGEKINERLEEQVQSFKQLLLQSPAITQELQRYFDKLIGSGISMSA